MSFKIDEFLSHVFLFASLSREEMNGLTKVAGTLKLQKNESLFAEGDRATSFYFIAYGKIKIYKLSPTGDERTIHVHSDGESIAEAAVFDLIEFPAHAKALEETLLVKIPREGLIHLIQMNHEMALKMLSSYSRRLREFVTMIEYLSFDDVKKRLAKYLLKTSQSFSGQRICTLAMNKKELASLIGTSPESLSRAFNQLKKEDLIKEANGVIVLSNPQGLEGLA